MAISFEIIIHVAVYGQLNSSVSFVPMVGDAFWA